MHFFSEATSIETSLLGSNKMEGPFPTKVHMHGCRGCIEKERKGLLELKASLRSISDSPDGVLPDWTNDPKSDCCLWGQIQCNVTGGHVIGLALNSSLHSEDHSPLLNLSLLYPFEELQSLDLSLNTFGGFFDSVEGYRSLGRLRQLENLNLYLNQFNNSILPFLNAASSLKTLVLRSNNMNGPFPMKELADLNRLEALDLSNNDFSGSLDIQGICELKNLQELDLSQNKFVGQVPLCFGSLTKLRVLDLSSNRFSGRLPSIFGSLESLEYLSLLENSFEGLVSFSSFANLSKLKVFKLSSEFNLLQIETESSWQPKFELSVIALLYCNLEEVPSFLMYQKELRLIDLSNNRLSGVLPSWLLENNTKLEVLLLQNNSFTTLQLPRVVHKLRAIDVSVNDFGHLLPEKIGWILPNLRHMNLSENGFQGTLPSSLGEMKSIIFLDLSRNNFSGSLPGSLLMSCHSLQILKLSHNKFSGHIFPKSTNLTDLSVLKLDNNQFTGKIGGGLLNSSSSLLVLDLSNNFLTGVIPSWMGNFVFLFLLSMSNNLLQGTIPVNLFDNITPAILDLSRNMLSGNIPSHFSSRFEFGGMLDLHDNDLTGPIPDTLVNNISILDLRNNKLSGNVPEFVDNRSIGVLLLRGNSLTGNIPRRLCGLRNIRLLDLAYNGLNGSLPSCLNNISFGLGGEVEPPGQDMGFGYIISNDWGKFYGSMLLVDEFDPDYGMNLNAEIEFAAKRRYDSYKGETLGYMFGLDLSSNDLSGEIPTELGDLQKIRALNLSRNSLSGYIPESFSKLTDMESLDLSFNRLYGRIPPQLTRLDFLAVFNVSYNNLSGAIPQGGHFDTLDESNYIGNPLLCGLPTNRSCKSNSLEAPDYGRHDNETTINMIAFYWSFAATYATVLLGILVFLCFDSPWRRIWLHLVDAFIDSVKSMCS